MISAFSQEVLQNRKACQARAAFSTRLAGGQAQFDANALDSAQAVMPINDNVVSSVAEFDHTVAPELSFGALAQLQLRQEFALLLAGQKSGASILEGKTERKASNAAQTKAQQYIVALGEKLNRKAEAKNAAQVHAESFIAAYGIH